MSYLLDPTTLTMCMCLGSDVGGLSTTAEESEDGTFYTVNGLKKWITCGMFADYFTTAVRTGDEGQPLTAKFLVARWTLTICLLIIGQSPVFLESNCCSFPKIFRVSVFEPWTAWASRALAQRKPLHRSDVRNFLDYACLPMATQVRRVR